MSTPQTIQATLIADLGDELAGCTSPPSLGVGCDGQVWVAGLLSSESLREESGGGAFAKTKLRDAAAHRIVTLNEDGVHVSDVEPIDVPAYFVQETPQGLLLAGARCRWRPPGAEKNAIVFDDKGHVHRRFTVGDGIQDLRVTPDGTTWASYFDEGIFGNFGWGGQGPESIGAQGLVAFSAEGEKRFGFDAEAAGVGFVCDVYALNVRYDDDVWFYYYPDFPIVHIHRGRVSAWKTDVSGASALAVREPMALLFGGYKHANRGHVVELRHDMSKVTRVVDVVDDKGRALMPSVVRGVGDRLYFLQGSRVWGLFDW